ncbi:MAG: PmoA family protein [Planctomycetes bacterium]|nr:PmoA family protein [Planctomycetota bacterium]
MALQLIVVPDKAISIQRGKTVAAAVWFGPWVQRPYIYPFLAPGGHEVTRLGQPEDPAGHSHHRSIWIGHHSVSGLNFWEEEPRAGRIAVKEILEQTAEGDRAAVLLACSWQSAEGKEMLEERRRLTFLDLPGEELALELSIELRAAAEPVTLGVSNFGLLGIRVARTLRVAEGLGGQILNSEEAENEAGCFGQHALWCDYSGPVLSGDQRKTAAKAAGEAGGSQEAVGPPRLEVAVVGISCWDHPRNSEEGTLWHVRDDGWMGPSLTRTAARAITREKPLLARYRLLAHAGRPFEARIGDRYREWRASQAK